MKQLQRPKIVTEIPGPKSRELWKLHEKYITKSLGMDNNIFVEEAKDALLRDNCGYAELYFRELDYTTRPH